MPASDLGNAILEPGFDLRQPLLAKLVHLVHGFEQLRGLGVEGVGEFLIGIALPGTEIAGTQHEFAEEAGETLGQPVGRQGQGEFLDGRSMLGQKRRKLPAVDAQNLFAAVSGDCCHLLA